MRKVRRIGNIFSSVALAVAMTACTASADERTGEAEGYGGTLRVVVSMTGSDITKVEVVEHHETEGVGTLAIDVLPDAIVRGDGLEVDNVSGATITSKAIKSAVASALGWSDPNSDTEGNTDNGTSGDPVPSAIPVLMDGIGLSATGRVGPGQDDQGNPVYSFNIVAAYASFDAQGRAQRISIDQMEVATPNYDGAGMPQFSGFPGQGGYAWWDDASGKTRGKTDGTEESFLVEVSNWTTKRMRGEDYMLGHGSWRTQMNAYEQLLVGKTVDEMEGWFNTYFSDVNGRPLKAGASSEEDQAKYNALSEEQQSELADITSGATMSLRDAHGDILLALRRAWEDAQARQAMMQTGKTGPESPGMENTEAGGSNAEENTAE